MSAKHKIKALRAYNRWRRGGPGPQPDPVESVMLPTSSPTARHGSPRPPTSDWKRR